MNLFNSIYSGRRVLVTGHTGFKGSWLSLWLRMLGADVCGISLDPDTNPNHFDLLNVDLEDHRVDIRDSGAVENIFNNFQPEIVFHLAAQPLVRRSYNEPLYNWSTNVMGTANVLEACRLTNSVKAIVAITTDKVYENQEWDWGYRESDVLGGHDPYSASKAACEILIDSYRKSFFLKNNKPLLASARAGNVIGGGDWSEDRLIPDVVRALESNSPLVIRSPNATRPWQHVIDCSVGYLQLGANLLSGDSDFATAWNFGPNTESNMKVKEILELMKNYWPRIDWTIANTVLPHEANLLYLDNSRAKSKLGWEPVWNIEQTVKYTADWYKNYQDSTSVLSVEQISTYVDDAYVRSVSWITQ